MYQNKDVCTIKIVPLSSHKPYIIHGLRISHTFCFSPFVFLTHSLTLFLSLCLIYSIIKHFAASKDDRRRVEKALDVSGMPSGKNDTLPLSKFQFEDFFNLYKNLTQRSEVEKIFDEL